LGGARDRWDFSHSLRPKRPYPKRSISACASAISGISGVGEKPLRAGGVDRAAGCLIELGEREGREQRIAACALLFGNGNGSPICVFGGNGIGGIAQEQNLAAQSVQ
jgi:hypothetical protein